MVGYPFKNPAKPVPTHPPPPFIGDGTSLNLCRRFKEQANEALIEKARIIGADAVIKVTYESGIGFTTWGYIDAKGVGVKFSE